MTRLMTAALEAGSAGGQRIRRRGRDLGRRQSPRLARPLLQHEQPAQAVRSVRAQDRAAAAARHLEPRRRACRSSSAANRASRTLDECSVVTAPYKVEGEVVGTVGVIGPTRMAYERVIPIVDITAKLLSSALTQVMGDRGVVATRTLRSRACLLATARRPASASCWSTSARPKRRRPRRCAPT